MLAFRFNEMTKGLRQLMDEKEDVTIELKDLNKVARVVAEFGDVPDIKKLGLLIQKYPDSDILKFVQVIGRHFSNRSG